MSASRTPWIAGSAAPALPSAPSPAAARPARVLRPDFHIVPTAPSATSAQEVSEPKRVEGPRRRPLAPARPAPSRAVPAVRSDAEARVVEERLRATVLLASAVLGFFVLGLLGLILGHAMAPSVETVSVQPGDSLYSIAEAVEGAPSTERALADIRSLNAVGSEYLQAGQTILVPRY